MPRKKLKNEHEILSHNLIVRVDTAQFNKLEKLRVESNCQTIAEIVRRILSSKKINCFYTDVSMNAPMEELVSIRKELKSIASISTRLPEHSIRRRPLKTIELIM